MVEPAERRRADKGHYERLETRFIRHGVLGGAIIAPSASVGSSPNQVPVHLLEYDTSDGGSYPKLAYYGEDIVAANYDPSLSGGVAAILSAGVITNPTSCTYVIVVLIDGVWVINNWVGCPL